MVSVLLATRNGSQYIRESIDSILNQTYKNFELLIGVNDTSDNTIDIINEYSDDRIKVFIYSEGGKAKTLNKLISESKYNWIAIQDDDDIWLNNKLESQLYNLKFDVIGTFINYINENGEFIGGPNLSTNHTDIKRRSLSGDNQIANTSALVKKSAILEIGGWSEDIDGIEDFDLWLRLLKAGYLMHNIPKKLVNHRLHNKSNFNTKTYDIKKII